jgi:hypothetical protein
LVGLPDKLVLVRISPATREAIARDSGEPLL